MRPRANSRRAVSLSHKAACGFYLNLIICFGVSIREMGEKIFTSCGNGRKLFLNYLRERYLRVQAGGRGNSHCAGSLTTAFLGEVKSIPEADCCARVPHPNTAVGAFAPPQPQAQARLEAGTDRDELLRQREAVSTWMQPKALPAPFRTGIGPPKAKRNVFLAESSAQLSLVAPVNHKSLLETYFLSSFPPVIRCINWPLQETSFSLALPGHTPVLCNINQIGYSFKQLC